MDLEWLLAVHLSHTSDRSQRSPNSGESLRSVYKFGENWAKIDVRTFARIKKVIWDQLLATKAIYVFMENLFAN